jgi:hypothetical protein
MKKAKYFNLFLLAPILLVTGCVKTDIKGGTTLLNDNTCTPPCWNSLVPGKTSVNDTFTILSQLVQVKQDSVASQDSGKFQQEATFLFNSGEKVKLIFQNDTLIYLEFFYPGQQAYMNITLRQLIDEFGEPDSIIRADGFSGDCLVAHFISLDNEKGIAYDFIENPICLNLLSIKKISPSTHISELYYYAPEYFDELIDNGDISDGFFTSQDVNKLIQPWKGYGNIEKLYQQGE